MGNACYRDIDGEDKNLDESKINNDNLLSSNMLKKQNRRQFIFNLEADEPDVDMFEE